MLHSTAYAQSSQVPAVERCPAGKTTELEQKTCPPNAKRPTLIVKRACCTNFQGRRQCKSFPHCPRESPS
jgi:hypothetical protein